MTDSNSGKSTPTVFQADEGDRWMLLGDKPLIFKVDPLSTGSDTLVVGTEEMPPGNRIPTHKHLYEDEVIFVHKGTVRVSLAGRQYDARTGATVFIPHGNWIGVENASSEPAMILVESRTGAVTLVSRWLLTKLSRRRLSPVWRSSVSCSRSSNRTGGFPASGSRKRHTMVRVTPPATSEHNSGWLDSSSIPCPALLLASVFN